MLDQLFEIGDKAISDRFGLVYLPGIDALVRKACFPSSSSKEISAICRTNAKL